jgi:hypothetical protein
VDARNAHRRAPHREWRPLKSARCADPRNPSTGLRRGKSGDMAERLKFESEQIPARPAAERRAGIGWRRLEPAMIFPTCCRARTWPPPLPCPDCGGCGFVNCCAGERPGGPMSRVKELKERLDRIDRSETLARFGLISAYRLPQSGKPLRPHCVVAKRG